MKQEKTSIWLWLAPAIIIWAVGLGLAAVYDLTINIAIYNPANVVAIIMECFGWYPVFLPALLLCTLAATQRGRFQALGTLAQLVVVVGAYLMLKDSLEHWHARGLMAAAPTMVQLLIGAAIVSVGAYLVVFRLPEATRLRLWFVAGFGTALLILNQVIIKLMKTFWNRTRFDDMVAAGSFEAFTPWYQPLANGGTSFPSGHTANAACILLLVFACDVFPALGKRRRLVYVLCWAFIALMAWSRVAIGRHYVSDTLAGSAVIAGLVYLLRHTKPYKKYLKKLQTKLNTLEK